MLKIKLCFAVGGWKKKEKKKTKKTWHIISEAICEENSFKNHQLNRWISNQKTKNSFETKKYFWVKFTFGNPCQTFRKQFWFITEIYRQKDKGHNCRIFVFAFRSAYLFSRPSQCDQIGRFFGSNTNIWRLFGLLIFKTSLSSLNCSGFFWKKLGNFLLQQLVTLALTVVCLFVLLRVISTCDL